MAASMVQRNLPFIKQQFSAALGNSSVVVKFVCVGVFFSYFLSFNEGALLFVTVTPGYVIPPNFWVWTFFTFGFLEIHVWMMLIDIAAVVLCGKLLEPLWGALEMLIFYCLVNSCVAVMTISVYLFIYMVTKNEEYLFQTHIHGLAGYMAGFAVAAKQIMPDNILVNSPFGKLRNQHIPLWLMMVAIVVWLCGALEGAYPIMFCSGIVVSWTYLRFYQKHSNGNRGDMADSFNFASFFPRQLQPLISILSNSVFTFFVRVKLCNKPQRKYDVSSAATITVSLPGTEPQDAERRRQLALKALNERLSKQDQQLSWPTMDEDAKESSPDTPAVGSDAPVPVATPSPAKTAPGNLPVPNFPKDVGDIV